MDSGDDVKKEEEAWLRANIESFGFFVGLDDEDNDDDDDDDDQDDDDE